MSKRTVQWCLNREGYHRRVVKKKVHVREVNRKKRLGRCRGTLNWRLNDQWDRVISLMKVRLFWKKKRIYPWRRKDGAESPDCICPAPAPTNTPPPPTNTPPVSTENLSYDMVVHNIPRCGHNYNCK